MWILGLIVCIVLLLVLVSKLVKKKKGDGFWVLPNSSYDYTLYYIWIGILIALITFFVLILSIGEKAGYDYGDATETPIVYPQEKKEDESLSWGIVLDDWVWVKDPLQKREGAQSWLVITEPSFEDALLVWPYLVDKVIDGDTIRVLIDGVSVRVRFIGINTPEIGDCFSYPAKDFVNAKVGGSTVYLELDESQWQYDKYGRVLAYVYSSEYENLNYSLVSQGYAREYTYNLPYRYHDVFRKWEKSAREKNLWLWNDCR